MIIIMGSPDAPSVGIYRRISKTSGGRGGILRVTPLALQPSPLPAEAPSSQIPHPRNF